MRTELIPQFDRAKGFYSKACVETYLGSSLKSLFSYDTLVAQVRGDFAVVYDTYSNTTLRHIKEFLMQNGFRAIDKEQIISDYKL